MTKKPKDMSIKEFKEYKNRFKEVLVIINESTLDNGYKTCLAGDIFIASVKALLTSSNCTCGRGTVRNCFYMIKDILEQEYGQSLFDEDLDNKIHGEKNVNK